MNINFTEASYENVLLDILEQQLGYTRVYGPDVSRDYTSPLYDQELDDALHRLNPGMPETALAEALRKVRGVEGSGLKARNRAAMEMVQNGVEVSYHDGQSLRSAIVRLVDYEHTERNSFVAANQWTYEERGVRRRPDIVVFLNGLPVVLFELKSPTRSETEASEAYAQIKNYQKDIGDMFVYNAICVMSDALTSKAGTITSGEDRYMEWKSVDGRYESRRLADYGTMMHGMMPKERLLDLLKNFICYSGNDANAFKVLAGYHQYFAVQKAVQRAVETQQQGDGKGGVLWHTQGSGKSLTMVFFAHLLQKVLQSPTILVITDRNDLDDQLFRQFSDCRDFLRQTPRQAESRQHLRQLLEQTQVNGIFFTTLQKFEDSDGPLSERRNVIVLCDEAHRSQYGMSESVDADTGKMRKGFARIMRESLPNATFVGFTGTPVSKKDRDTKEVFGDYIDIYDMSQAVADHATRPVYYESRVVRLKLDEATMRLIDQKYDELAANAEADTIERSKQEMGNLEAVLGADKTIHSLVDDILEHYETHREHLLTGKAMIVAYSRSVAMKIYRRIMELRPTWGEKVAVVMTSSNKDPEDWHDIVGNKRTNEQKAIAFKDNDSPLKIAIVVDMWLTGFDLPSLSTLYCYKAMKGDNLMQAIARVNRVFGDKEGGLVVDYIGLATALRDAMKEYTVDDQRNFGNNNVAETALRKFEDALSVCRDKFHEFDYSPFFGTDDAERLDCIGGGLNFIMAPERDEQKTDFLKHATVLHQALQLCSSVVSKDERYEAAFFEAVRVLVMRLQDKGSKRKLSLRDINKQISELLKNSIQSDGVINLFHDAQVEFSLFDEQFIKSIAKMPYKNIAVEMLRKLIADQVQVYKRRNVVKSELFSERMQQLVNKYLNSMLTNEEVIEELLKMAHDMKAASANTLGLTEEEEAFYDALTRPQAVKDAYTNDQLVELTRELTKKLRASRTVDWQKKESARADMRRIVKRLLKRYKYPPEKADDALDTVMQQCELWADNEPMTPTAGATLAVDSALGEPKEYHYLIDEMPPSIAAEP